MKQPRLIIVYGAAGVGKTTIARRYSRQKPLTICVEGDQIIAMISSWVDHEQEARALVFSYICQIASQHLQAGHDVVIPYLLQNVRHAQKFADIAARHTAQFSELYLAVSRQTAVDRLYRRGSWGEPDAPPLTEMDRAIAKDLFDQEVVVLRQRPEVISIDAEGSVDETYKVFVAQL